MYEEEKNEKNYFFRNLTVKVLLVLLFVFLLMWLFPMPNLSPFYDKIFTQNLNSMTDAAKGYFTTSRLPSKEGETKTITLKEMLDNKMLIEFTDSNDKTCDVNKSYVEVTKKDGEYIFKTNLSCSSGEDYVIEYFGCYDVCETCDKTKVETKDIIEYQFYKVKKEKLIDKYFCKNGYTLSGSKCILEKDIEVSEPAQTVCSLGYTYNKNTNKCEKEESELLDASIKCETGYYYASSMNKCIKLDTTTVDAEVSYKCNEGTLNTTTNKCIIEKNPEVSYKCSEGTLNTTTNKCIVEKDPEVSYKCSEGTISGNQCAITTSTTTPYTCSYKWTCGTRVYTTKQGTSSSSTFTRSYIGPVTGGYKYEECVYVQDTCSGGVTTYDTSYVPATPEYKCSVGTLNETTNKCIIENPSTPEYKCLVGTLNTTTNKCITETNSQTTYNCNEGTLNGSKCTIEKVLTKDYTYQCLYGNLVNTNKCLLVISDKEDPTYSCKTGYSKIGTMCYKLTTTEDIENAQITYKTVSTKVYKWSRYKTLEGWTATGKTRKITVKVTSK